jgi:hypothetical protein
MELNKEKKMKSEQAVLPNPCLEEEECARFEACHGNEGSMEQLRNIGVLSHQYMMSQPEDVGSVVPRNVGILPHHYTASQP